MRALRSSAAVAALLLAALALVAPASAYTCTQPAPQLRVCDVNDDGVPDFHTVIVPGEGTFFVVAYRDPSVTSVGVAWVTYGQAGYHSGGVSAGCYDPNGDLDCDYGSVAFGSTDVGYTDLQKFGGTVRLCNYGGVFGYGCIPLL